MMSRLQESGDDQSVAAAITRTLADRIVSGALAPGERLRQDHIAAEFRASHVPVREAFRRLDAQGLVVTEPRRGVRVASMDPADVVEVAEMRAALEALAVRHALPRLTPGDIAMARSALDAEARSGDNLPTLEEANRRFHAVLIAPCGMPRLVAAIADLHRASARHLFAAWRDLTWQTRSHDEHRAILVAVAAKDADVACTLLADHITAAGRALAAVLRHTMEGKGPYSNCAPII